MRLAWLTDTHFDHAPEGAVEQVARAVAAQAPAAVVLTGDIANADTVVGCVKRFEETVGCPTYVTLGNHDYWGSAMATVDAACQEAGLRRGPVHLGLSTTLLTVSSWYDGVLGHGYGSRLIMNDWALIDELRPLPRAELFGRLKEMGARAAENATEAIEDAFAQEARHVVVATHVPPFREAAQHRGTMVDDHYAPFFVCEQLGQALRRLAEGHPEGTITVLCGHAHERVAHVLGNLRVYTGAAEYGKPKPAGWVDVTDGGVEVVWAEDPPSRPSS